MLEERIAQLELYITAIIQLKYLCSIFERGIKVIGI